MLTQCGAKMFLSAARGVTELDWFRSYSTFNSGAYQNGHKDGFGHLYTLNEHTLGAGRTMFFQMQEDSDVVLVPTVGAVTYTDSAGNVIVVEAGQALRRAFAEGTVIEIGNPYESELVNFLQLLIRSPYRSTAGAGRLSSFNPDNRNCLMDLFPAGNETTKDGKSFERICIGKFTGRQEAVFTPGDEDKGIFVFVIQGAFEVQNRLLEAKDGLAIWNTAAIELEALSNDAVILLIEVPVS